tara:strand:- start:225 stop:341 length:117 start_codon:yes stop_codon:yes gene_type:complete
MFFVKSVILKGMVSPINKDKIGVSLLEIQKSSTEAGLI